MQGMAQPFKVMIIAPRDGIYGQIALGFNTIAAARGWAIDLPVSFVQDAREYNFSAYIDGWQPDALIISSGVWERLAPRYHCGRIIVGAEVDLTPNGVPSVVVDDAAVGEAAAHHLLDRGFRHFAAYGVAYEPFALRRATAFRDAVLVKGGRFTGWGPDGQQVLAETSGQWVDEIGQWVRRVPRPGAVFACCDDWARRLASHCHVTGVRVPEELAIVGVDNDPIICELTRPPLSSVRVPWDRLGHELALTVNRLRESGPHAMRPECVRIRPTGVAVRRSSDTVAVADPDVAAALAVIREHAASPIDVPSILRQVPVFRRSLERRFREHVGHTIMQEVRRAHVERAKHLLLHTDLSTAEVARHSGFSNASKLAAAFRKECGTTPLSFRKSAGAMTSASERMRPRR
jgi:LacI family transcriptional regulator